MNKIINSGNSQDKSHEAPNWKSPGACDVKTLHEKELEEKPSETGSGKSQGPGEKKGLVPSKNQTESQCDCSSVVQREREK